MFPEAHFLAELAEKSRQELATSLLQVPEYADFSDLSERVYFPGDLDMGQFKNHTLHPVIWSDSGKTLTLLSQSLLFIYSEY